MKVFEIEVPISSMARVTVQAENEESAKQMAVSAVAHEMHGKYTDTKDAKVYVCDEYESFTIGTAESCEVINEFDAE